MIRVALSTSVAQRGKSGVASYLFGLLDGFAAIDAPVQIILLGLTEDRPLFQKWLHRCEWVDVAEKYRPPIRNILWHQTTLRQALKKIRADVLHIPSYRRIVWNAPIPQVATIHDCAPFVISHKYDWPRMFYGQHVVTRFAAKADQIITVSQTTADDVAHYFKLPRQELHVVLNGLDHSIFHPRSKNQIETFHQTESRQDQPYFLYLARLEHPAKNHVRLIGAFELFCQQHPTSRSELLFGGADWHGAEIIHQRIASSPYRDRIRSLGFVDKTHLPFWYAGANAMVYPSLFEGFGLPPAEAMACGCPVICSQRGALAEVVGDAARIIDPESENDLATALAELDDPISRQPWIDRGLARAKLFDWKETARQVTDIYLATANS